MLYNLKFIDMVRKRVTTRELVISREDVINNIKTLYNYVKEGNDGEKVFAEDLIRKGKNFVVEQVDGKFKFSPSRYSGYLNNNFIEHNNNHGDGRKETSPLFKELYKEIIKSRKRDNEEFSTLLDKYVENLNELGLERTDLHKVSKFFLPTEGLDYINKLNISNMKEINSIIKLLKTKKQIILQGAPGTGKTYYSAEIAVKLCDDKVPDTRKEIMERYRELKEEGRIAFTTFHQSMDYEEFVEGLKPVQDSDPLRFEVTPGIFKRMCEKANRPIIHDKELEIDENVTIWKVTLKNTGDNDVRRDCLDNNRIRIGWSEYGKDLDIKNITNGKQNLDYFINTMEIGDVVLSCYSEKLIDAIGIIEGEYEWDDSFKEKKRVRRVNWIVKDIREDIYELNNNKKMSRKTIHKLSNISVNNVLGIIKKNKEYEQSIENNDKPYVLIIDEINRGNISKILGELITLLENDKRKGEENELQATLPYSNEKFSVPSNLYIIGTMNTADRSLGYIDYAIRRRFAFYTLESNKKIIENHYNDDDLKNKAINIFNNVKTLISGKIASDFIIKDLMIGHSYFLAEDEEELQLKLEYEIKPLLREYANDGIINLIPSKKDDESKGTYLEIEKDFTDWIKPIQTKEETSQPEEIGQSNET